jgi:hypothetical protein
MYQYQSRIEENIINNLTPITYRLKQRDIHAMLFVSKNINAAMKTIVLRKLKIRSNSIAKATLRASCLLIQYNIRPPLLADYNALLEKHKASVKEIRLHGFNEYTQYDFNKFVGLSKIIVKPPIVNADLIDKYHSLYNDKLYVNAKYADHQTIDINNKYKYCGVEFMIWNPSGQTTIPNLYQYFEDNNVKINIEIVSGKQPPLPKKINKLTIQMYNFDKYMHLMCGISIDKLVMRESGPFDICRISELIDRAIMKQKMKLNVIVLNSVPNGKEYCWHIKSNDYDIKVIVR